MTNIIINIAWFILGVIITIFLIWITVGLKKTKITHLINFDESDYHIGDRVILNPTELAPSHKETVVDIIKEIIYDKHGIHYSTEKHTLCVNKEESNYPDIIGMYTIEKKIE